MDTGLQAGDRHRLEMHLSKVASEVGGDATPRSS